MNVKPFLFSYFEKLACEVTKQFDKHSSSSLTTAVLLFQKIEHFKNMDCIELAMKGKCLKFTSLPCVQRIADILWYGKDDSKMLEANKEINISEFYPNANNR